MDVNDISKSRSEDINFGSFCIALFFVQLITDRLSISILVNHYCTDCSTEFVLFDGFTATFKGQDIVEG